MTILATTPSISMMDLRSQPGTFLDRVFYRNESIVIERAGEPKAVLIPLREYQDLQRRKQEARERFWEMTQEIRKNVAQYDPAEIQAAIDEAISAVRKENRHDQT
jgi:prevent-host-death family protein